MTIRIVTDSSCDLPEELLARHRIGLVPLSIRFGDEELLDRVELPAEDFWDRLPRADVLPETSAPSAGAFEKTFRDLADDDATGIVCVSLSSKLSATMQAAQVAASALESTIPVRVVDSMSISMGLGNLCLVAAHSAAQGADLEAVADTVIDHRERTRLIGTLDTLEYLKKGGRIGGARALLGSMLSIKPIVEVRDGGVEEGGKVRTRRKALAHLAERVRAQPVQNLAVMHGGAPDLDELLDLLAPLANRDDIVTGVIGPVMGTHTGPRTIGVTFHVG